MYPPIRLDLDVRAISGITGCISIAFWVIVFSPQIIVNFRRQSAEGLSLNFLAIWLAGDIFNVLGAVLQGVLPTMIILAIYYTLADIVLLFQCLYYRYRNNNNLALKPDQHMPGVPSSSSVTPGDSSTEQIQTQIHSSHLSPATPLLDPPKPGEEDLYLPANAPSTNTRGRIQAILLNTLAVLMVTLAGIAGWYISGSSDDTPDSSDDLDWSPLGQTFGYLCAILYLASRVPQIWLNYRRKSCEGISFLFFLFACLGNLTYVISILAYVPPPPPPHGGGGNAGEDQVGRYWRYVGVNASWLLGSVGTLGLDMIIFIQFFIYGDNNDGYESISDSSDDGDYGEDRAST